MPKWGRIGAKFGVLLLGVAGVGAITLPSAWQATQRREAYLSQLTAMAQRDPYDGRLLALLGGRQLEAGQFAPAANTLEHAGAAGENSESVWLCLAAAKAAIGDPKSIGYLQLGAHRLNSSELATALARAQALKPPYAAPALATAISPNGAQPLISAYARGSFLNGLVAWWWRRHPAQSGFSTREAWAKNEPNNPEAQRLWGLALLSNGRPVEAAAPLQHALQLAPNSPSVHLALATLLEAQSPTNASLEYIACLKLHPDWVPALLGLGRMTMLEGMPSTAAEVYREATQVGPESAEAWVGLGEADVAAAHNFDVALRAFQTATRLAPARTDYLDAYAVALRQNGRWSEAEAMARRCIEAEPNNPNGHYTLAAMLMDYNATPGRLTEALEQTRIALRLAPKSTQIQLQLAGLLLRQNEPREAMNRLQQVIAADPGNVNALLTLARAARRAGLGQQAQQATQRAASMHRDKDRIDVLKGRLQAHPADTVAHAELAELYARTGQPTQSQQERQVTALLRRDPNLRSHGTQTMPALIEGVLRHP